MTDRGSGGNFWLGFWHLADPKISLASIASLLMATAAAAAAGPLAWRWLLITMAGVLAVEIAKNALGEVVDYDSGTDAAVAEPDRSPFSGGKRVLIDGLLTRAQTLGIAVVFYGLGVIAGLCIAWLREPKVLWLGVLGMFLAYAYHGAPFRLSYRGLGELAVAIAYGPLIACGTYLVQRGDVTLRVVAPSLPLAAFIAAFLWINQFPDYAADRAAGKRNLVVRLGRERARWGLVLLFGVGFAILAALPLVGLDPRLWLGFAALPIAWSAATTVVTNALDTRRVVPAQARTLLVFLVYAVATSVGLLWSR